MIVIYLMKFKEFLLNLYDFKNFIYFTGSINGRILHF